MLNDIDFALFDHAYEHLTLAECALRFGDLNIAQDELKKSRYLLRSFRLILEMSEGVQK